jgi:hypothetical protein
VTVQSPTLVDKILAFRFAIGAVAGGRKPYRKWRHFEDATQNKKGHRPGTRRLNLMDSVGRWGKAERLRGARMTPLYPSLSLVEAATGSKGYIIGVVCGIVLRWWGRIGRDTRRPTACCSDSRPRCGGHRGTRRPRELVRASSMLEWQREWSGASGWSCRVS